MVENHNIADGKPKQDDAATQAFASAPASELTHFKTKGEHKFDRLTYNAIGYVANVALSIGAVYWVERTRTGQQFMRGLINKMQQWLPKANPKNAEWLAARSFYLAGGFAVIPAMKMLEDRKVEKVKAYDREIYGDKVDTDPVIIKSHKELEAAPKQNWASIVSSRLLALAPFYAVVGLLWNRTSVVSQWTNRGLREAGKTAVEAAEATQGKLGFFKRMSVRGDALDAAAKADPTMASQGLYMDRPITAASRFIGKQFAKVTGNTRAVERIEETTKQFPGAFKEAPNELAMREGKPAEIRDPAHAALPYYFISEAITSALVARGVYVLTRMLGPIIGNKVQPRREVPAIATSEVKAAPEVHAKVKEDVAADVSAKPRAHVAAETIEHTRRAPLVETAAAR